MNNFLENMHSPEDLQELTYPELNALAQEIRSRIIEVMSVNGGHLASNLGTVELTLALHKAFQSPSDKFIWDVGHQTYTHKILTGRNDRFETIRQFQGLCGFSHPKESPHDHFHSGHAGPAISLALGVAKNRDLSQRQEYIIPIIGDATLTCGMSLEALNNIPGDLSRFIIILNDNGMSISDNVGAMTRILSRFLSNPTSNKLYHEIDTLLSKVPTLGASLVKQGHKIKQSLKNLVSSAAFFEQFGISYIGPIDGHDIKKMVDAFNGVKNSSWPVLIHVLTNKGQGMEVAIKNPTPYHGAKPFCISTGKFLPVPNPKPTFPKIFGKHLLYLAENDPSLVAVTPAMSCGSCLDDFMKKFPERCIDVGIAESHSLSYCGGISYGKNMKVVASVYSTFLQRALDNLFHDICLQELPVVLAIDRAGISGPDGATHHGIYDIGFLNAMPNMVITQPRDGHVLKELMDSAFSWGRPAAIRYPNLPTDDSDIPRKPRPLGQGEILAEGEDLLVIALGHMNQTALELRELLLQHEIRAAVVDPVFVKPLDSELFFSLLTQHSKVVTIEEHSVVAGLGSIINNFIINQGFTSTQVLNLGIPETFVGHGKNSALAEQIGLTPKQICERILSHFSFPYNSANTPIEEPSPKI